MNDPAPIFDRSSFLRESCKVKAFLRKVVPAEAQLQGAVGGAGSFFLYDYDSTLMDVANATSPNDVDIFVCAEYGRTAEQYFDFMKLIVIKAMREQYQIVKIATYKNLYVNKNLPIFISDIYVADIALHFSFVQCPLDTTVATVVDTFDIDIVRVVYDIRTGSSTPKSSNVAVAIHNRILSADNFIMKHCAPTNFEKRRILSTLGRIRKYRDRGFSIRNIPQLIRCPLRQRQEFAQEPELQHHHNRHDIGWQRNKSNRLIRKAVFQLESNLPAPLMRHGKVMLMGSHPFALFVCLTYEGQHLPLYVQECQQNFSAKVLKQMTLDVVLLTPDSAHLLSIIRCFIRRAFGNHPPPDLTMIHDTTTNVTGMTPCLETVTVMVPSPTSLNYRFIRVAPNVSRSQLLAQQIFSFYQTAACTKTHELKLTSSAEATMQTGRVQCGNFHLSDSAPSEIDVVLFGKVLANMQFYFRRGWTFDQYPTLVAAPRQETGHAI